MKLYTFNYKNRLCIGVEKSEGLVNLSDVMPVTDMVDFITRYHGKLITIQKVVDAATEIIP